MTTFDPAAWLEAFASTGGWWAVAPDGGLWMGWRLDGFDQTMGARGLYRALEIEPSRKEAVKAALIGRA